jgi:hypothetical protein
MRSNARKPKCRDLGSNSTENATNIEQAQKLVNALSYILALYSKEKLGSPGLLLFDVVSSCLKMTHSIKKIRLCYYICKMDYCQVYYKCVSSV